MNLSLLLSLAALAQDGQVVLPASEVLATLEQAAPPPEVEGPPITWLVPSSKLRFRPGAEMSTVALEVALVPIEPGWVSLPVLDGRVRLTAQSLPLHQGPDGSWWFTGYLSRPLTLRVEGTLAESGGNGQIASLRMAQGVRQEVLVEGRSGDLPLVGTVDGQAEGVIAPRSSVSLSWGPERPERASSAQVIQAEVSTAAWLDEGALNLRSKVRWEVRRGSYERLRLRVPAGATELDVTGVGLARWERQGNEVIIEPLEAVEGAMELQIDWRQTFVKGQAQVTHPQPLDASNTTYSLTLAGDSETLLSPSAQGMRAVAVEELPPKARAIGDAPANAAWTGPGTLSLQALKLNSLDGPDLVVDLARCTAAQSPEGRTLMTCSLDVRNASKQFLGITLPEGFTLWSARVNGDGVSPVRMDNGNMNVPLERSVETLAGLTAIAVELTFLGDEQAWDKKGERAHQLPAFDAPVARIEWELRLPPGYKASAEGGSARIAGETTTELVYASASEAKEAEQAREVWNMALDAYQDNDFETAQAYVDQTLALDGDNYNAVSLQTNLDVLSGDADGVSGADEAMSRRVKDMAKAKVADDEVKQKEKLVEAERLLNEGRYEEAIESYEEVEEMSKELARYEHVESKKQSYYGSSSSSGAAEARNRASSRDQVLTLGNRGEASDAPMRLGEASPDSGADKSWNDDAWEGEGDALNRDWKDALEQEAQLAVVSEEEAVYYKFDDDVIYGELGGIEADVAELKEKVFDSKAQLQLLDEQLIVGGYLEPESAAFGLTGADVSGLEGLGAKGYGVGAGGVANGRDFSNTVEFGENVAAAKPNAPQPDVPERTLEPSFDSGDDGRFDSNAAMGWMEIDEEPMLDGQLVADPVSGVYAEPVQVPEAEYDIDGLDDLMMLESTGSTVTVSEMTMRSTKTTSVVTQDRVSVATGGNVSMASIPGVQAQRPYSPPRDTAPRDTAAPPPPPPPVNAPLGSFATLDGKPAIQATTLAIPLPDHGESVVVVQRLLDPGEAPTLTIRYRETR